MTQALTIHNRAGTLQPITSPEQAQRATELLSQANLALDELIKNEEKITKPLNEAIKAARAPLAAPKKMLKETIQVLRDKLSQYQTLAAQNAAKEAAKIADKVTAGTLKVETGVRKLGELDTPADIIAVDSGSLTFRAKEVLKIVDANKIPREYLTPNESLLLACLQKGQKIPGVTLETIQVPINRRA